MLFVSLINAKKNRLMPTIHIFHQNAVDSSQPRKLAGY